MPLFGPSLSQMRRTLLHQHYTLYSIARLSIEMLNCIEDLHNRGYLHCDVKPGNFLIRPNRRFPVCLIDFGLSRSYRDSRTGKHYEFLEDVGFCGTCRYASIHAHREQRLSRRDDLISWMYSMIELAQGKLPWPGLKNRSKTIQLKEEITAAELCRGLPRQFVTIWKIVRRLGFS
jgi:serine/threonine protein kinase